MLVLMIGVVAFAMFFAIHQPLSKAFTIENKLVGPVWPLNVLTVYRLILGDYDVDDFQTSLALLVYVLCVCFASILLLNLLIAIMGDSCKTS